MAERVARLELERVRANLAGVRERITLACSRAGRDPNGVEIVAATKYVSVQDLGVLADAGIEVAGENIAKELVDKHARWSDRLTFDFIGHLQSRKTKQVLPRVRLIHSVESESVLDQVDRHASGEAWLLLEVNVAGETSKYGLDPGAVDRFIENSEGFSKVRFGGLMTMPPLVTRPDQARRHFAALRELADRLRARWAPQHAFAILSMGTSQDFEVAVEEGATIVRLGSVLYA